MTSPAARYISAPPPPTAPAPDDVRDPALLAQIVARTEELYQAARATYEEITGEPAPEPEPAPAPEPLTEATEQPEPAQVPAE